jgi:hypothetical protein
MAEMRFARPEELRVTKAEKMDADNAESAPVSRDPDPEGEFADQGVMTGGTRVDEVKAERDVIFRDKIVNYAYNEKVRGREPAPLTVGREVLDEARTAFVPPAGFTALPAGQLLIIQVGRGRGGGTAATRRLLDAGVRTVKEFAPDVALRRLTPARLEPGTGYLLRNAAASVVEELTEFEITRLDGCLAERDSRLVLTVDPRVRLPESLLGRYVADLGDPPTADAILAAHLRRRLRSRDPDGVRTEEILGHPMVAEMLADSAQREDRVARAASFARILADAEHAGDFDLKRIADQLARITGKAFEAWFDQLSLESRCFAIALATLPGHSYESVSEAAIRLEQTLSPPVPPAPGEKPPDPFRIRRTERLNTVLARVSGRPMLTRYGVTPMEVVTFIDPSLIRLILDRVWAEYPEIRPDLLTWLRELARHPVRAVRYGAAGSVGVFAVQAFDYVRRTVIEEWARSDDVLDRQAAAVALISPAQDPSVSAATRSMVWEWHLDRSPLPLRNTAARAYGHLGEIETAEALDAFGHLATEVDLFQVTANSITLIIARGDEVAALETLRRLCYWIDGPDVDPPAGSFQEYSWLAGQDDEVGREVRTNFAYFAFLLASIDARLVDPVDDRPDATAWFGLLWLADRNPEIAAAVAELWGNALIHPVSYEDAAEVLTVWAINVETDSVGRAAFGRLVAAAVAGRRRAYDTVVKLTRSWTTRTDADAPRAAEAVLAALTTTARG